ncbi:cytidine deaminase-like protein [Tribonema minus]|uniref:dCMP deaminase n=1 Tax=Tribonema minus TaxID=303371 RepID=A0A835YXB8_9STRA|nr:cytidine deaminase-like protein [Tribonema minus]
MECGSEVTEGSSEATFRVAPRFWVPHSESHNLATWRVDDHMNSALAAAAHSTDPLTQVGAVFVRGGVVLASGTNRVSTRVQRDADRTSGALKALYTEHAERDAIFAAAREGISLEGSTCVCTLYPCADCARGIIACGAVRLVTCPPDFDAPSKWREHWVQARQMLAEAGVDVEYHPPAPSR